MRITTRRDRMTTMNTKCGDSVIGQNADDVRWKKNGWVSISATGAAVSLTAWGVDPKVNGHTKQVRDAVKCNGSIVLLTHRPLR